MIPAIEVRHRIELVRSVRMPPDDLVFFTAPGDSGVRLAPKPGTECTAARWMTPAEIGDLATNPDWLPLTEDLLQ